jgi:hypothetical protein
MQNRIVKTLTSRPRQFSTNILYSELNVLKLKDIHNLKMYSFIHQYTNCKLSSIFNEVLNPHYHCLKKQHDITVHSVLHHIKQDMANCYLITIVSTYGLNCQLKSSCQRLCPHSSIIQKPIYFIIHIIMLFWMLLKRLLFENVDVNYS